MCIQGSTIVGLRVYERLISRGVKPARAEGIAKKVSQRYEAKRLRARQLDLADAEQIPGQLSLDDAAA